MGGDIGIAFVTTLVARRAQLHQARLVEAGTPGSASVLGRLAGITRVLEQAGAVKGGRMGH